MHYNKWINYFKKWITCIFWEKVGNAN